MPLVRIDLTATSPQRVHGIADAVQRGIVDALGIPQEDRFQVITQHDPIEIICDPTFMGIDRTPDVVLIQVTMTSGRPREMKTALFNRVADELSSACQVRRQDIFISLVEAPVENFSIGNGESVADRLPTHLQPATETQGWLHRAGEPVG